MATMDGLFWQQFGELVIGGLRLDPEVCVKVGDSLQDRWVAATVLLLAGFSQAIGQSMVLIANRIKPLRFVLSLGISALIYFVTFIVWVLCIWLTVHFLWRGGFTIENVFRGLAVSDAPQLLGVLVAAPYFGMPIAVLLSIWTWVTQTYQIGGHDPDSEPIAPTDFSVKVPKIKRATKIRL